MASASNNGKNRHVVSSLEDLPPGERKIVKISGREIGVFNIDGTFYALRNMCPHKQGPLCMGRIRPLIVSAGGTDVAYERENEILKCPWHQWEFDIKTGQALFTPNIRARTYSVCQEGDEVVLYT